jgi:flavin-dependent dehydrogenase
MFADVVEHFDLDKYVIGRYCRFTFHSPLGNRSSHDYDAHPLLSIDYRRVCDELLRRSQIAGNVHLISSNAESLQKIEKCGWRVILANNAEITTPVLVDASGRGLFATRALRLRMPSLFSHCFGQTLTCGDIPAPEEAYFLAPSIRFGDGGGWFYPLSGGRVSFGFATLGKTTTYPAGLLKERYYRALREFAPYADWLANAKPDHDDFGTIPICYPRKFVYDRLVLVGDAAAQATIWSCMGCESALVNGQLAGHAIIEAHRRRDYSKTTLGIYQHRWNEDYRRIYLQGKMLAPLIWKQGEVSWNRQVLLQQQLTPIQKLAQLRSNLPLIPWWKIAFMIGYDWAGRIRRGIATWLKGPNL